MIKTFVLFWFVIAGNTGSPATGSQEFLSKETCLAAKAEMDKKEKREFGMITMSASSFCTEK
jgi:hypothetical protein